MTPTTQLERIFSAFASEQLARDSLLQIAVLGVAFGLAGLISRSLRARLSKREVHWKFGEGGFNRVIFPLAALAFTWVAALVLRRYMPVTFLNLAVTLLIAFTVIRTAVYVLRFVLRDGAFLRGSERTIAWTMWVGVLLYVTGLLPEVAEALDSVSFELAKQRISLLLILQAAVAVAVTLAVAMWLARVIEGRVMANDAIEMSTRVVVSKFVRAIALFLTLLIALPLVGLDLTALTVFGGALGVGLGFGLQKIASNYVSGYIILLDHSIRIGDLVTVDNRHGVVGEIAARYTVVRSSDGTESIIPNETLITQSVTNHSYTDRTSAVKVLITVGYDSDLDAAIAVLQEAALAHPRVLKQPEPGASVTRLGEAGIDIELTAWINDPEIGQGGLRSDILRKALASFRSRGVIVPPPPRDVRVIATPETVTNTIGSGT